MAISKPQACLSDEQVEEFVAGPVPDALRRHIEKCCACRARIEIIRENNYFLTELRDSAESPSFGSLPSPDLPPSVLECRVVGELHRGGQGVVYKAVHESTGRKVAIKTLLNGALSTPRQRHRFEREIEVIANLRHPHIVTLYGSTTLPDGRAAFSMEYIHGRPITEWADKAADACPPGVSPAGRGGSRRAVEARLRLFMKVCDAVQHAHQHGVIHRDLKPGNILVDRDGEPHVLDFGMAKIRAAGTSRDPTITGEFLGSPAYASPEQAQGDPEQIDTRSDVYSLGVVLYQFLTGAFPYPVGDGVSFSQAVRNIAEAAPRPPSQARPGIDGELETIVLKTLAKEPDRRYQSAGELRDDLGRYLEGRPIAAKRDSGWYLLLKMASRHRGIAALAVLLVLTIASAFGVGTLLYGQTARARAVAEERAAQTEQVLGFVREIFSPSGSKPAPLTTAQRDALRSLLDPAVAKIDSTAGDATLRGRLHAEIGRFYRAAGHFHNSTEHFTKANELFDSSPLRDSRQAIENATELGEALRLEDQLTAAEEEIVRAKAAGERTLGPADPIVLRATSILGGIWSRQGHHDAAVALVREALETAQATLGAADERSLQIMGCYAECLRRSDRVDEASQVAKGRVAILRSLHGDADPRVQAAIDQSARIDAPARLLEMEQEFRQLLDSYEREHGSDHPLTIQMAHQLAVCIDREGRHREAATALEDVLASRRRVLGDTHSGTITTWWCLGRAYREAGAVADAEATFGDIVAVHERGGIQERDGLLGAAYAMRQLGELLAGRGERDGALHMLNRAWETVAGTDPIDREEWTACRNALAACWDSLGEADRAREVRAVDLPAESSADRRRGS